MPRTKQIVMPPAVQVVGDMDHADFRDAIGIVRAQARLVAREAEPCDLIIFVQSRPNSICAKHVEALRRASPLAGVIALVGSWCEGETRTGRPLPGVERLHWYEFPAWWRRQLALRAFNRCPDWARPDTSRLRAITGDAAMSAPNRGLAILRVPSRETAAVLADVLHRAGYATAWQRNARSTNTIRGAIAGIWDGGQLNDHEADDLGKFCGPLARSATPVIVALDFPRRDSVDRALELGATAVLGKPWINAELVETLQSICESKKLARAA
jgi:hypothetical protein